MTSDTSKPRTDLPYMRSAVIDDIIRDVCELPGRTSPEAAPDVVTLTVLELQDILEARLPR